MKIKYYITSVVLALSLAMPVAAQNNLREGSLDMIVAPHDLTLGSAERTTNFQVRANVEYTVSSDADWLTVRTAKGNRVYLHLTQNYAGEARVGKVTLANAEKGITQTLTVTQKADDSFLRIPNTPEAQAEYLQVFTDMSLSQLKEGITRADIEPLTNPFCKALAMQMLEGTYKKDYRVSKQICYNDPHVLSDEWNAPGKLYDQLAGVTGIHFPAKSKMAVMVTGIPEGKQVQLKIMAWWTGKEGNNFDGGNPNQKTYTLQNGFNLIDYDYTYEGLAYVSYYDAHPETMPELTVHFVNGIVNGYLSPDKTNQEMYDLCAKAPNLHMDCWGNKVHSVWTSDGLKKYCKDVNGNPKGYRQFMNVLDSLIAWEHRSLGFEKYDRLPNTRSFAYVNYTYYMFQGGYGVSFHHNQEQRVLSCKTLITNDDDAIWGLSHEWGHQHQMQPYFCWGGLGEVSNNVQSYYNITHMGYRSSDKINQWAPARRHFLEDYEFSTKNIVSDKRREAYKYRNELSFSPKMYALAEAMEDSVIHPQSAGDNRGVGISEVGVGETLCPFIMLVNYWTNNGFPDFTADYYESLRQNDDPNGSQIEKQGEVDKYELLASAQNGNKNNKWPEFKQKYPESCWVVDQYITDDHHSKWENSIPFVLNYIRKTSRLVGYDLTPYFEKWGFLRNTAQRIGDYGNYFMVCTTEMLDEFKADQKALIDAGEIKAMPEGMVEAISNYGDDFHARPTIAN